MIYKFHKKSMLKALDSGQRSLCVYDPFGFGTGGTEQRRPAFCDCKYGCGMDPKPGSESTGCPELRVLKEMLDVMTDYEWKLITNRVVREAVKRTKQRA